MALSRNVRVPEMNKGVDEALNDEKAKAIHLF